MNNAEAIRIVALLERIAVALEAPKAPPAYVNPPSASGYWCSCGTFVLTGMNHVCAYHHSTTGGDRALLAQSGDRCQYLTAANMQCVLQAGHGAGHDLGIY